MKLYISKKEMEETSSVFFFYFVFVNWVKSVNTTRTRGLWCMCLGQGHYVFHSCRFAFFLLLFGLTAGLHNNY